jgi:hypothetical protein
LHLFSWILPRQSWSAYFPIEQHYTPLKTMSGQAAAEKSIADASDGRTSAERIPLTHLLSSHDRLLIVGEPGNRREDFLGFRLARSITLDP